MSFDDMLLRELASVALSPDGGLVTFTFQDGGDRSFSVAGDCCSDSWIEHLELPGDIVGAVITKVVDGGAITQDHPDHDKDHVDECIQVYNTTFHTDRGDIVLEYRNSSNGYYGGCLVGS